MVKQKKQKVAAHKYLTIIGIVLYILTPFLFIFGTPVLGSWLPCIQEFYGSEEIGCNPPILFPSLVLIFTPLVIGSILILIGVVFGNKQPIKRSLSKRSGSDVVYNILTGAVEPKSENLSIRFIVLIFGVIALFIVGFMVLGIVVGAGFKGNWVQF